MPASWDAKEASRSLFVKNGVLKMPTRKPTSRTPARKPAAPAEPVSTPVRHTAIPREPVAGVVTHEMIATRAYFLSLEGSPDEIGNWLRAEAELKGL